MLTTEAPPTYWKQSIPAWKRLSKSPFLPKEMRPGIKSALEFATMWNLVQEARFLTGDEFGRVFPIPDAQTLAEGKLIKRGGIL